MGLLTSILNPKVALFYLALFPQFVEPARGSVLAQSLVLGLVQIVIALIGDTLFILAAARVSRWLAERPALGGGAALAAGERVRGHRGEARVRRPAMTIVVAASAAIRARIRVPGS